MKRKSTFLKKMSSVLLCIFCLQFLVINVAKSADLTSILPVTNNILVVHFDDGHVDYLGTPVGASYLTGPYEGPGWGTSPNNRVYMSALNVTNATNKANYTINGQQALYVGYKGKPAEINGAKTIAGYEYDMYILLPFNMTSGQTITVTLNNLATNTNSYSFVFDEKKITSPTIQVNQVGFTPSMKKYAYLSQWLGTYNNGINVNGGLELDAYIGKTFHLVNFQTGAIARTYTNAITLQKAKGDVYGRVATNVSEGKNERDWTYAEVLQCNFSDFTTPGEYIVVVDGMGCSFPFHIGDDAFNEAFYYAAKGVFWQRQGIVKRLEYFGDRIYKRGHHPADGSKYYYDPNCPGTSEYGSPAVTSYTMDNAWGHYYDAGDWDHRGGHWLMPMACMFAYDLKPGNFRDGEVSNNYKLAETDGSWINEGTNGIPDILDEAVWLVNWGKKIRAEGIAKGFPSAGGVPHYTGVDAGAYSPSWTDKRNLVVSKFDPDATLNYVGAAAYYAYCLKKFNSNGGSVAQSTIDNYLNDAKAAYTWAYANNPTDNNSKAVASAALYAATGDAAYQTNFISAWGSASIYNQFWEPGYEFYASSIYLNSCKNLSNLNTAQYDAVKARFLARVDPVVDPAETRGYRLGGIYNDQWADHEQASTPMIFAMATAHAVTGVQKYRDAMESTVSYFLGGNQLRMVTMSGLGENQEQSAYHPDSWWLMDLNSKVYRNPVLPGYTPFGRKMTWINLGLEDYTRSLASPSINSWPFGESRFSNRETIEGSEFTLNQTLAPTLLAYALMKSNASFTPNARPTLSLSTTSIGYDCASLAVSASSDTRMVKYYYGEKFIGQSTDKANGFLFNWVVKNYVGLAIGTSIEVTAVAYDDKGMMSLPSTGAAKTFTIVSGSTCGPIVVDTQAPTAPSNLTTSSVTTTSFTLSWTASTDNVGVTSYEVFAGTTSKGVTTTTSMNVTGLTCGTTYSMTVKAKDAAGNVSASSAAKSQTTSVCPTTDTQAPSAPGTNSSSAITSSSFTLTWGAATDNVGVVSYEVFAGTTSKGVTTSTSMNITGLAASTSYSMTVKAKDAAGNISAANSPLVVTTLAPPVVTGYRYLKFTVVSGTNVKLQEVSWLVGSVAYPSVATSNLVYDLVWNTDASGIYIGTPSNNAYTYDAGSAIAVSDVKVIIRDWSLITAFKCEGSSDNTNWTLLKSFTGLTSSNYPTALTGIDGINSKQGIFNIGTVPVVDTQAPTAPSNLTTSSVTATSFNLSWTASTDNVGVTSYEVFAGTTSKGVTTSTSMNVTGLTCGTAYNMTVKAKDAAGNVSASSAVKSQTTSACAGSSTWRYLRITYVSGSNLRVQEVNYLVGTTVYPLTAQTNKTYDLNWNSDTYGTYIGTVSGQTSVLDLGATTAIAPTKVRVTIRDWSMLSAFRVEGSTNNSTWTELGNFTGLTAASYPIKLDNAGYKAMQGDFTLMLKSEVVPQDIEVEKESAFRIYPNPANEYITIENNTEQLSNMVRITDMSGREVYANADFNGHILYVNVSEFNKGMYLLTVKSAQDVQTMKFIIK